jgi:hypothetical protein
MQDPANGRPRISLLGSWVDIVGYSVVENEDGFEERMTNAWSRFPTGRL